jgi:5-methylcytosine-specific restriction endonuclease McrA
MRAHSLPDHAVLPALAAIVARDRSTTVEMLDHIAVADARGLYRPEGFRSMFLYCVSVLRMSEDIAYKRIRAARTAQDFPAIFYMIADGRLNLSAVVLLAPYLKTVDEPHELLAAATNKTNRQIEHMLAERFPQPDIPTTIRPIGSSGNLPSVRANDDMPELLVAPTAGTSSDQLAVRPVLFHDTQQASKYVVASTELPSAPAPVQAPIRPPKVAPLSPRHFSLQLTMGQEMHDRLRRLQELLSQKRPSGDIVQVIDRAFDIAIQTLEKRKNAATERPRPSRVQTSANPRYISADVRRAVRKRDGEQCTFVSESGHRCEARRFLEYDHIVEVARGGQSSVDNLRLRCRAHNQFAADGTFGSEFMNSKRRRDRIRGQDGPGAWRSLHA